MKRPVPNVSREIELACCAGLLALLSVGRPAAAQSTSFLLAPGRAGALEIGLPVDSVLRVFGRDRVRLVDLQLEGHFTPAIELVLVDSRATPALVAPIREVPCGEFALYGMSVYDPRFRTREGVGVGSTIGELRRAYGGSLKAVNSPTLCERCRHREATVRISVTTNAEERIQHLCAQCADATGGWRGRMVRLLNWLINRAPSQ